MSLFTALDINTSGLTAQRRRFEVTSSNLNNAETTRTFEGGPYRLLARAMTAPSRTITQPTGTSPAAAAARASASARAMNEGGSISPANHHARGLSRASTPLYTSGSEGVEVGAVIDDTTTPFDLRYDPGHPDADPTTGYVSYPNVNTSEEMINMMSAARSYEANIAAIGILKTMINRTLELGR